MYLFSKYFSPRNFRFAEAFDGNAYRIGEESFALDAKAVGDDMWALRIRNPRWPIDHCRSGLHAGERTEGVRHKARLEISRDGEMALKAGTHHRHREVTKRIARHASSYKDHCRGGKSEPYCGFLHVSVPLW